MKAGEEAWPGCSSSNMTSIASTLFQENYPPKDIENYLKPSRAPSYFSLGLRDFLSDPGRNRFIFCRILWELKAFANTWFGT